MLWWGKNYQGPEGNTSSYCPCPHPLGTLPMVKDPISAQSGAIPPLALPSSTRGPNPGSAEKRSDEDFQWNFFHSDSKNFQLYNPFIWELHTSSQFLILCIWSRFFFFFKAIPSDLHLFVIRCSNKNNVSHYTGMFF